MALRFGVDFIVIRRMIREFTTAYGHAGEVAVEPIYQSNTFGADRQVLKVSVGQDLFALKFDFEAHKTGRLKDEYSRILKLSAHFEDRPGFGIPQPIYLSPKGNFFVLEYVGDRIASKIILKDDDPSTIGQVFRRAGMWLNKLHEFTPQTTTGFWPNWMLEAIDVARARDPHGEDDDITRMRDILGADAVRLQGRQGIKAFCHGDFHANNLILGRGVTYGFDVTEAGEKLSLYDIVDFLKIDALRKSVLDDVDKSGVSRQCKKMFLKRYRHPIDSELLDFCIRGRLLIDWASITKERFEKSAFQQEKFLRFKERLDIAFQ